MIPAASDIQSATSSANLRTRAVMLNAVLLAFIAEMLDQLLHEGTHAVAAVAVGARIDAVHFWGVHHVWPSGVTPSAWDEGIIAGSAALVNIVLALIGMAFFARVRRPLWRLPALYFVAYNLLTGFGYLAFDPLFANEESYGDWAKVVMLLGGGWGVRLPIMLVGAGGVLLAFFWTAYKANRFTWPSEAGTDNRVQRKHLGALLLVVPYIAVNAVFSVLALWHPLGAEGTVLVMIRLWMGFSGLVWAFVIGFISTAYGGPFEDDTPLAPRTSVPAVVTALAFVALAVVLIVVGEQAVAAMEAAAQ